MDRLENTKAEVLAVTRHSLACALAPSVAPSG
jgi:hypothetical protein